MPKIIKLTDIKIKSIELYKSPKGELFAYLIYGLKDENGQIWENKRYTLKDFDNSEKKNIEQILKSIYQKIKAIEKI